MSNQNNEVFFPKIHPYIRGAADLTLAALDVLTGGTAVLGQGWFSVALLITRMVLVKFLKGSTSKDV